MAALKDSFFFSVWTEKRVSGTLLDLSITHVTKQQLQAGKKLKGLLFKLI